MSTGKLQVTILEAKNFTKSPCDSYCMIHFGKDSKEKKKTRTLRRTLTPVWNETLNIKDAKLENTLVIEVLSLKDNCLGIAKFPLRTLNEFETLELDLDLLPVTEHGGIGGMIKVELMAKDFGNKMKTIRMKNSVTFIEKIIRVPFEGYISQYLIKDATGMTLQDVNYYKIVTITDEKTRNTVIPRHDIVPGLSLYKTSDFESATDSTVVYIVNCEKKPIDVNEEEVKKEFQSLDVDLAGELTVDIILQYLQKLNKNIVDEMTEYTAMKLKDVVDEEEMLKFNSVFQSWDQNLKSELEYKKKLFQRERVGTISFDEFLDLKKYSVL